MQVGRGHFLTLWGVTVLITTPKQLGRLAAVHLHLLHRAVLVRGRGMGELEDFPPSKICH